MTDADSIWESKLSRLQDPKVEKMKPLVELMGELGERRRERGAPVGSPRCSGGRTQALADGVRVMTQRARIVAVVLVVAALLVLVVVAGIGSGPNRPLEEKGAGLDSGAMIG
jgi:hypothetical protein